MVKEERNRYSDEPLRPIYRVQRPPYWGYWSDKEYKGQTEWWAEPGLKDPLTRAKLFRGALPRYREEDKFWYDPPVPDGTSLSGPFGKDNRYTPNLTVKADTPGNLFDWQKKVIEGSHQYKQIAGKYELSKEHPGLPVTPTLDQFTHARPSQGNLSNETGGPFLLWHNSWHFFGPRFWDKPLNEGCFEKGLCMLKYAAIYTGIGTFIDIRASGTVPKVHFPNVPMIARLYFKNLPLPAIASFSWAVALCTAANVRHVDDVKNHWVAAPALGFVVASLKNSVQTGVFTAGAALFAGVLFHYARVHEYGIKMAAPNPVGAREFAGPLGWKGFQWGEWNVSKRNY